MKSNRKKKIKVNLNTNKNLFSEQKIIRKMKFSWNHFVSLAFIYIISSVLVVNCVSIANGCGSYGFLINNGLKTVGEGGLIDCCNAHDCMVIFPSLFVILFVINSKLKSF